MAQTMGPKTLDTNLTIANKMKISLKGVNAVRSSYGGNLSSRPGTSHRVMGASNYNTHGGVKNRATINKATTSLGHVQGSPSRLSSKKKNLME